jgi:hypothetical protein
LRAAARTKPAVAAELRREAGYFLDNQRRMQYQELREDGFPIGSGMVESGCKRFRARFNEAGMRWSRPGIKRLLPVRAAITPAPTAGAVWVAASIKPGAMPTSRPNVKCTEVTMLLIGTGAR